jgi:hypothetical protein
VAAVTGRLLGGSKGAETGDGQRCNRAVHVSVIQPQKKNRTGAAPRLLGLAADAARPVGRGSGVGLPGVQLISVQSWSGPRPNFPYQKRPDNYRYFRPPGEIV